MIANNQITLLPKGDAYFPALEAALDGALLEIYLETYIFENDHTGQQIAEALRRAAQRGVKTHLLVDGFGSIDLPKTMLDVLKQAGVMVLVFRPNISPWTLRRRTLRRLHRKIAVVDRNLAFVGGINIIDDVDTAGGTSPRYDYAVRVEGPLVKKITASCRRLWLRVAWSSRLHFGWRRISKKLFSPPSPAGRMRAAFVVRDNFLHRRNIEDTYLRAIERAQSEILLANAYFLPGQNFRHALVTAARRGVRVVLLLQGKIEHRLAYYAARALFGTFLDAGIEVYEYHQSILHAKVAVIDGRWATVGSSNLDPFSLLLALEANIVVEDPDFAATLKDSLEQAMKIGAKRVSEQTWRSQPVVLRLVSWISYGMVRFMSGIAGYAPNRKPVQPGRRR
jgi:cardiolipin synthase A/B